MPEYPTPWATTVSPLSDVPVELFEQYMDEFEVARATLVQPTFPGEENSYVADCAAANPSRFAAVCVVDPRIPGASDRLDYWVRERGCKGLRLRPRIPAESAIFSHRSILPLWHRAAALKLVVSVYAGTEHLATVAALAERFPDVPILLDHMAGYPYTDCAELFRALYDRFGPTRLIWGSDFPHVLLKIGYRRSLLFQQRAYPFLSQADLDLIMGGNAAELYWS